MKSPVNRGLLDTAFELNDPGIHPFESSAMLGFDRKLRARSLEKPQEPPRTAEVDLDSLEYEDPLTPSAARGSV